MALLSERRRCALLVAAALCIGGGACSARAVAPGVVPLAVEGFALGTAEAPVLARLKKEGWQLEREARPGGRLVEYRARHPSHARLRYLRVSFADGALYYVRAGLRRELRAVGKDYLAACDGGRDRRKTGLHVQCASPDESRALSVGRAGDRVTLLDLRRAVAAGAASPATVRKMLSPTPIAPSTRFGRGTPRGPLPREAEELRLGDSLTDVLERFKPPLWKLRTFGRERGRAVYRHVQLRSKEHPVLRELLLDFIDRILVRARFYFRVLDSNRAARESEVCAGHFAVPARMGQASCREGWKTQRAFDLSGRSLALVDLAAALKSGFLSREEIDPSAPTTDAPPKPPTLPR